MEFELNKRRKHQMKKPEPKNNNAEVDKIQEDIAAEYQKLKALGLQRETATKRKERAEQAEEAEAEDRAAKAELHDHVMNLINVACPKVSEGLKIALEGLRMIRGEEQPILNLEKRAGINVKHPRELKELLSDYLMVVLKDE